MNDTTAASGTATLQTVSQWAQSWGISEQQCHKLRKHPAFPPDATVTIGARCVRFRVSSLNDFAARLAADRKPVAEPSRLKRAREERKAQPDPASAWIKPVHTATVEAQK